jgi:protein-S-isoprenylcysteine O-methyltransferase Ste14
MPTTADPTPPKDRGPAVPFPPPLLFVGGIVLGVGITGILTFRKFRTAVLPHHPASVLVDTGISAYTRNPMYTGLTTAYLGGVLLTGALWVLILLPIVLTLLITQVIRREERYHRTRFPEAYAACCTRVGRWC